MSGGLSYGSRAAAYHGQRCPARGTSSRLALALMLLATPTILAAQDDVTAPAQAAQETAPVIDFEAREIAYDSERETVTAQAE